ncbi:RibD family protein [Geminicoccus roseus]|uniref:RibD family protein n=1 Tax=Geminicoccus roseus TaxID=404900 RepID=UPI0003FEA833|nr:RibD family protein [Geminicoccus roseus]
MALIRARVSGDALPADIAGWSGIWQLYLEPRQATADGLYVIAHLGQSLDGKIAAANGQSCFVTGEDDLLHMHRLRALVDAVVVGAGTVFHDDPRLTVRLCHGPSPVRVVLDPSRRLGTDYRVFRDDGPRTLLLTLPGRGGNGRHGRAEVLEVGAADDGCYCPRAVLGVLAAQGLPRLMIEGGGATVARFWQARCLDRLDLCIAPVIIGKGRDALPLPSVQSMDEAERFQPERLALGPDSLHVLRRSRPPLGLGKKEQVAVAHPHAGRRGMSLPAP